MTTPDLPLSREKRKKKTICFFSRDGDFLPTLNALQNAGYKVDGPMPSASTVHNRFVIPESFDLIVTGLDLLYTHGITSLKILRTHYPQIPIVVHHSDQSPSTIAATYRWGGRGYVVVNQEDFSELIEAVDVVASGGVYSPPAYAADIVAYLVDHQSYNELRRLLTETEYKIVAYLYQSWPTEKIAEQLNLTIKSTRTIISRIKKKLEITDARFWQLFINSEYPDCVNDIKNVRW